jgi:hypothetical protein
MFKKGRDPLGHTTGMFSFQYDYLNNIKYPPAPPHSPPPPSPRFSPLVLVKSKIHIELVAEFLQHNAKPFIMQNICCREQQIESGKYILYVRNCTKCIRY